MGSSGNRRHPAGPPTAAFPRFAAAVLLAVALSGCLGNGGNARPPPTGPIEYVYDLELRTNTSELYSVIVPAAVDNNGNVSEIMAILPERVAGAQQVVLVNTEHGWGLRVDGSGNISIALRSQRPWDSGLDQVSRNRHPNGDLDFDMFVENTTGAFRDLGFVWIHVEPGLTNRTLEVGLHLDYPNSVRHAFNGTFERGSGGWAQENVLLDAPPPPPVW